jgi:hypothetical protein
MLDLLALAPPLGTDGYFYWHFPILVILVNLVYSATRYDDPQQIVRHALKGILYILTFLGVVFAALYFLANYT